MLMLAACAGGQVNKNVTFDRTSENGLVIVGLTTPADPWRTAPQLVWSSYETDSAKLGPDYKRVRHRSDEDVIDFLNAANLFLSDSGGHNFLVFSIPPGTWVLEQIHAWRRHQTGYSISSGIYTPTYDDTLIQTILRSNAHAFTVETGEAIYVGELVITDTGGLHIRRDEDDLDSAKEHMAEYTSVSSPLVYRPLEEAAFTCAAIVKLGIIPFCEPKAEGPLP